MLERIVDGDLEPVILVDFAQFTDAGTVANLLGTPVAVVGYCSAATLRSESAAESKATAR